MGNYKELYLKGYQVLSKYLSENDQAHNIYAVLTFAELSSHYAQAKIMDESSLGDEEYNKIFDLGQNVIKYLVLRHDKISKLPHIAALSWQLIA